MMDAASKQSMSADAPVSLEEIFATVESLTGLEISIYPPVATPGPRSIDELPVTYRRHMSEFCRLVKRNKGGRGCGGHDSNYTNRKAAELGKTFVQVCHAGVAEAVIPVFGEAGHLATVFIGQVVTEEVASAGFSGIWQRVKNRDVDRNQMRRVFAALPRMSEQRLLGIARLLESAIQGVADRMSFDAFERQVRLHGFPQIMNALDILRREKCWNISLAGMASRVHISPAYFSRLFKKVMGSSFSDYLTGLRMTEAQNLLHMTDLPISAIADRLGYSRQSYFTRRFRMVSGMTPSQYRRNMDG